tara:strand:- start:411 stop:533 length:123 start_codon:yes stop_codon:yes gene_type:complete
MRIWNEALVNLRSDIRIFRANVEGWIDAQNQGMKTQVTMR